MRLGYLAVYAALAVVACKPNLPPVAGCEPTVQTCRDGRPYVCSGSQRWEPAGDLACAAVGGECAVSDAGVARCVRVRDGGVE